MISRRAFLGTMLAAGAGAVVAETFDPERLLWVPGAKTIFLPSKEITVAHTLDEAINEGLLVLYPDGTRWAVRGEAAINHWYGGYANLVKAVEAEGGRILQEWTRHPLTPAAPAYMDEDAAVPARVALRYVKEWDIERG